MPGYPDCADFLLTFWSPSGGVAKYQTGFPFAPRSNYRIGFGELYSYGGGTSEGWAHSGQFFLESRCSNLHARIDYQINKLHRTITLNCLFNQTGSLALCTTNDNWQPELQPSDAPWWITDHYPPVYAMLGLPDYQALPEHHMHFPGRAANIFTPEAELLRLGQSESRDVRCDVAENPSTPERLLRKLAEDPDINVRLHANRNLGRNEGFRQWFRTSLPAHVAEQDPSHQVPYEAPNFADYSKPTELPSHYRQGARFIGTVVGINTTDKLIKLRPRVTPVSSNAPDAADASTCTLKYNESTRFIKSPQHAPVTIADLQTNEIVMVRYNPVFDTIMFVHIMPHVPRPPVHTQK